MVAIVKEPERKRQYHSPRRQEAAERTRQAILASARHLFAVHGYTATTLPAIARDAGVSAPTVTAVFGTKSALLEALINEVLGPDSATALAEERPVGRYILGLPDAASQVRALAAGAVRVHGRGADVYHIVRGAAAADEDFAAVMHRRQSQLWADMRSVAAAMARRGELAPSVTAERAADILWALCGPETYRLFVIDRGWSPEEYERWLVEMLTHAVLHVRDAPS
jgi:AcrR family transcriptional regulator